MDVITFPIIMHTTSVCIPQKSYDNDNVYGPAQETFVLIAYAWMKVQNFLNPKK